MKRTFIAAVLAVVAGIALATAPADTYVYQTFGEPVSFDPVRAYDTGSGEILENVYETLITYDGAAIDQFIPALATSWEASPDLKTWTFHLRQGVKFHSGNTMTCRDAEWSFKYGMVVSNPEGSTAYLMGNQFLGTQIDGSDPQAFQDAVTFEQIDHAAECLDDFTLQLNLTRPEPAMLAIMAFYAYSVIDSQWAIANGMWDGTEATWTDWIGRDVTQEFMQRHESGTGAYQVVEWTNDAVVAKAFPDYWGGKDPIDNVVIQYVDEQSTRILALQQGDADAIQVNERSELVKLRGAPGVDIMEEGLGDTSVTALFFNFDINTGNNEDVGSGQLDGNGIPANFFQDVNVRRGFAELFDQQAFIDQIYEGDGYTLTMGLPNTFLGYNPDVPVRSLDLEAAEGHFRAAFGGELWDKGFEFTALYNAGNTVRQTVLEIIKENLEFLNPKFTMNIRSLPWSDFLARTGEKKAPIFVLGWGADYADPINFIDTFYSNSGFYSSRTSINLPEMQAVIDQADSSSDPSERAFLYKQVGTLHYDLAPLVVVPEQNNFTVFRDTLQGVYYNPMLSNAAGFLWKAVSKK